jgi:hypothetical protein
MYSISIIVEETRLEAVVGAEFSPLRSGELLN